RVVVGAGGRSDPRHRSPPPGPRDVNPPLTSLPVEWAEAHRHAAGLVRAVADAQEDHGPLVALHVLQVLHEKGLVAAFSETPFKLRGRTAQPLQFVEDAHLLALAEGDHSQALL